MKLSALTTLAVLFLFCITSYAGQKAVMQDDSTASYGQNEGRPRFAVVNLSVNFLREEPDYTAELGTQALMGHIVRITGENGYWRQVVTDEPYTAWCTDMGLVEMTDTELEAYKAAPKYICTAWKSTVYTLPDGSGKICDLVEGDILRQKATSCPARQKKTHRRKEGKGFAEVMLPDGNTGYVRMSDIEDLSEWEATRKASAANIITEAMKFTGVPYLWGGTSPNGVDCSGLVRHVFLMNGISLPRNASSQAECGTDLRIHIDTSFFSAGVRTRNPEGFREEMLRRTAGLKPGDLLFFGSPAGDGNRERITHVGIYIGQGEMIHSSQIVRINSLIPSDPDYYDNSFRLLKACRIIPQKDR